MHLVLLPGALLLALAACGGGGKAPVPVDPGGPGGGGPQTAVQIVTIRSAADAGATMLALPLTQAIVTGTFPLVGTAPAGFLVQALQAGPALTVLVDPAALSPAPVVGSVVSFTVTAVVKVGGLRAASAITGFAEVGSDAVAPLLQSINSVDFTSAPNIDAFESEIVSVSGTLASAFTPAGTGFVKAQLTTTGVPTASTAYTLRVPTTVQTALALAQGCTFTLTSAWLLRFDTEAQVTVWTVADFSNLVCPP